MLLDEIGDMPMRLQVKLLRVLQENQVRPVGSTEAIDVDVRVISATHRNLQEMMREGDFREDLFYRLNVVQIILPILDDRREDIPLLVSHFLQEIAKEAEQERKVYAPEAVELLVTAEWPGNIRQLYNVVRQNVALSRSPVISGELVQTSLGEHGGKLIVCLCEASYGRPATRSYIPNTRCSHDVTRNSCIAMRATLLY